MGEGLAQLTDKEKEALRLILVGHDAKSTARTLDISVHTVNDRLRNARRKLSVSSSREAARILGAAEAGTPQNLVHASTGMGAGAGASDNADLNTQQAGQPNRMIWLAGGMLIMSIAIAAAIVFALGGSGTGAPQEATETSAEAPADAAGQPESILRAQAFLATVDAGDWKGSWEVTGPTFQSQASAEEWATMVEPVRAPLGEVTSREITLVQRTETLPGAPGGDYEVIQFTTKFSENPGQSVETLIMILGEDGWEVNGYFIR